MKRSTKILLICIVIGVGIATGARYAALRSTADARFKGAAAGRIFDPFRDASADLQTAERQATANHKNLLLDVGGNWCPSCILLDQTLKSHKELQVLLDRNYVLLHVNWSSDNRNDTVLNKYPEAHGYPALYVLAQDGQLIKAEDTTELESSSPQGTGYNQAAIAAFLTQYSPHP